MCDAADTTDARGAHSSRRVEVRALNVQLLATLFHWNFCDAPRAVLLDVLGHGYHGGAIQISATRSTDRDAETIAQSSLLKGLADEASRSGCNRSRKQLRAGKTS